MASEQYFQEAYAHHDVMDEGEFSSQKWKSVADPSTPSDNTNGSFNCNICLDHAQDPVVTLCGHLYCWPCIYKWLHFQSESANSEQQQPQCPVCKADVSHATLVPLYGHGESSPEVKPDVKGPFSDLEIPSRPPACGVHALITTTPGQLNQHQQYHRQNYSNYTAAAAAATATGPMFNLGGTMTHPMVGMFGEMVYGRVFRNSSEVGFYGYPNSYHLTGSSSPRMRRQEMKAEKSLNRISIFLFCCFILCLLLF